MSDHHVCPWWLAYTFDNPLRRLIHNPTEIFSGNVEAGMTVMDIGCGMGYFSIALAEMVGDSGQVIAVDLQQQMLDIMSKRAAGKNLNNRITPYLAESNNIFVETKVDFVLAFWMLHEVADPRNLLEEVKSILRPHGRFLIVEPIGHVSSGRFEETVQLASSVGYEVSGGPAIRFSRSVICSVPEN